MALQSRIDTRPVDGFAKAIAARDFDGLAWCLHPDVRFRALTPHHTFGLFGSDSAIATFEGWLNDVYHVELVSSEVAPIGDRVRVSYRFNVLAEEGWMVMEQQAYCAIEDGLVTDISLVCSGRRPGV